MKSSVLFYCAFAVVVISYTMFGLDWQPATLSAMPDADVAAYVAPVPVPRPVIVAAPAPVIAASPPVAAPAAPPARTANTAPRAPVPSLAPSAAPEAAGVPKLLCDVAACTAAYRSFRESDCTYNPSFGDRKLCTKGVVPTASPAPAATPVTPPPAQAPAPVAQTPPADGQPPSIANPEPGTLTPPAGEGAPTCNVAACATAYPRSFRESDCTFNPSSGPRQVCKK